MSYRPIKKDLTEGTVKCYFCNRPLNSLKTYILENLENNKLVNAGRTCAEKNIDNRYNLNLIPDLTKYTLSFQKKETVDLSNSSDKRSKNHSTLTMEEENLRTAIEYLELRENKLAEKFHTSYPTLKNYYIIYQNTRHLDTDSVNHILNLEKKAPENYKIKNLQKCYNYSFWLSISIARLSEEANRFLTPVFTYLKKNMKITENQKKGINNWLIHLDGIPQLK
jgi:hypothetical protein